MKRKAVFLLLWLACGVYAWGTLMADLDYGNGNDWKTLHLTSRDNVGIVAAISLAGPMGAVATTLASNFNQHGWELWNKPKTGSGDIDGN